MPIEHVITLPVPPSINELYRIAGKRLIKSRKYIAWIHEADGVALTQKPRGGWETIKGPFTAHVIIDREKNGKADLDNRSSKALLDFCQRIGLVKNDKACAHTESDYGTEPVGCRVTLRGEG